MGNNQRSPPAHNLLEPGLDLMLCLHIDGTGCIIENQNPRILQERSGNGNTLLLAA
ncbi:hypothetical protein D3C74_467660 [compost metagenome]